MPKSDKAKTAGKFLVMMLCFAILFFLLLPFLEEPAAPAAAQAQGKKASPQIFTANPLSELVRKVYSLFAGQQKQKQPQRPPLYADSSEAAIYAEEMYDQSPRYAAAPENAEAAQSAGSSSSSYYPENYNNYGEAGFVNEEGEWILVRQTAPEGAQRGMHDINSSDSAYDKLVRMERAAKYTGGTSPSAPAIPDSKWARLFRPIKKIFGLDEQKSVQPRHASDQEAVMLASSDGLGTGRERKPNERFRRGQAIALPQINGTAGGNDQQVNDFSWDDVFNSDQLLDEVVESIRNMANEKLDPEERKQLVEQVNRLSPEQKEFIRNSFYEKMQLLAQDEPPADLLSKTFPCGESVSGTYSSQRGEGTACSFPQPYSQKQVAEMARKSNQEALQNQQESLLELARMSGKKRPEGQDSKVKMLVLLGKAGPQNPLQEYGGRAALRANPDASEAEKQQIEEENKARQRQDETLKAFYDFMLKEQGCDQGECYYVGSDNQPDPSMANRITSSGVQYMGDPLNISQQLMAKFAKQQQEQAQTEEEKEQAQYVEEDLKNFPPYYLPYNSQNMAELNKNNTSPAPRVPPPDPFLVYVPTAGNAAELPEEIIPFPGLVFYGGGVLDEDSGQNMKQAGETLRNMFVQRGQEAKALAKEAIENITDVAFPVMLQQVNVQTRKQMSQDSSAEKVMGLSAPAK